MPARTFSSGASSIITCALGATNFIMGPGTVAAICRRVTDSTQQFIFHSGTGTSTTRYALEVDTANKINLHVASTHAPQTTGTFTAADGWCLIAGSKATGTVAPNLYKYAYAANTWSGADVASVTAVNSTAPTGSCYLGTNFGGVEFAGDIAVVGCWNVVLTDAQIQSLAFTLNAWWCVQPRGLWVLDQSATTIAVPDMSGNGANQSSTSGTSIATSSVPVFTYGFDEIEADTVEAAAVAEEIPYLVTARR